MSIKEMFLGNKRLLSGYQSYGDYIRRKSIISRLPTNRALALPVWLLDYGVQELPRFNSGFLTGCTDAKCA